MVRLKLLALMLVLAAFNGSTFSQSLQYTIANWYEFRSAAFYTSFDDSNSHDIYTYTYDLIETFTNFQFISV